MNGILKKIAVAFLSLALMTPMVDAQNHRTSGNRGGNHTTAQRPSGRPTGGNTGNPGNYRPGNNNNNRPNHNNRPNNNRPGNNGGSNKPGNNHKPDRPGNNGGNHRPDRPGNNGGNHKPGNNHRPDRPGNNGSHRPGNNHRPGNDWHFGRPNGGHGHVTPPRPGHPHRPPMIAPPMRPHRPIAHGWTRPVPPPAWRPRPHAPSISAILGITFGTAFGASLDYLYGRGYVVDGYGDNRVYLRDVNQFNYYWPDATLYYGNGVLTRSEFLYSTSYPDMIRYNSLYNSLMGTYGSPVNYVTNGASITATWFAPNRGYVTLQYAPQYSVGGALRYFTTITFGL